MALPGEVEENRTGTEILVGVEPAAPVQVYQAYAEAVCLFRWKPEIGMESVFAPTSILTSISFCRRALSEGFQRTPQGVFSQVPSGRSSRTFVVPVISFPAASVTRIMWKIWRALRSAAPDPDRTVRKSWNHNLPAAADRKPRQPAENTAEPAKSLSMKISSRPHQH